MMSQFCQILEPTCPLHLVAVEFPCQAPQAQIDALDPPQVGNTTCHPQGTHQLKQTQMALCRLISYGKLFQSP